MCADMHQVDEGYRMREGGKEGRRPGKEGKAGGRVAGKMVGRGGRGGGGGACAAQQNHVGLGVVEALAPIAG